MAHLMHLRFNSGFNAKTNPKLYNKMNKKLKHTAGISERTLTSDKTLSYQEVRRIFLAVIEPYTFTLDSSRLYLTSVGGEKVMEILTWARFFNKLEEGAVNVTFYELAKGEDVNAAVKEEIKNFYKDMILKSSEHDTDTPFFKLPSVRNQVQTMFTKLKSNGFNKELKLLKRKLKGLVK